jgi:hypothetical protein
MSIEWGHKENDLRSKERLWVKGPEDVSMQKRLRAVRRKDVGLSRAQAAYWLASTERQSARGMA